MSQPAKIDLRTAPLSLVKAIALSLARDIDSGKHELRAELERVMVLAQTAQVQS